MKITTIVRRLDFLTASGSTVLCSLIMFFYNLYVKTYVMPYEFGIYTTANLVFTYLGYLQCGVLNSYNRDYARLLGGSNSLAAEKLRRNVFTYLVSLYSCTAVLGAGCSLLLVRIGYINNLLGMGLAINAVSAGLAILYNFFDTSAKSEGRVIYASLVYVAKTVLLVGAGFFAVRLWGYWGMFAAAMTSAACPFLFYLKRIRTLRFSLEKPLLWELVKTGAPLLVSALIWTVTMSVDKFIILTFMTISELGVYSTAMLGFSTLVLIPSSISQILYIRMSRKYGETNSVEELMRYADRFTYYVGLCTGIVSVLAYFGLPFIVKTFIPGYIGGIASSQILILGVSLYSTTMMYGNVFSILKLNAKLLKNSVALCIFNIIFSTAFVLLWGKRIEYVAYGTSLSYALFSVILTFVLGRTLNRPSLRMLMRSWLPIICVNVPCVVFSALIQSDLTALVASAAAAGVSLYMVHRIRNRRALAITREEK